MTAIDDLRALRLAVKGRTYIDVDDIIRKCAACLEERAIAIEDANMERKHETTNWQWVVAVLRGERDAILSALTPKRGDE